MPRTVVIEEGNRIKIPDDWLRDLGLTDTAEIDKTDKGVLIHSSKRLAWDEVFALKARINSTKRNSEKAATGEGEDVFF